MKIEFQVESVNISERKGVQKHPAAEAECIENHGIKGDAHAGEGHRQVSLLAGEAIDMMRAKAGDFTIKAGDFAENLVTRGMDWTTAKPGGRIVIGSVVLEVTQIGKECHTGCAIANAAGECIMPKQGVFTKVIKGGKIHAGNSGYYYI